MADRVASRQTPSRVFKMERFRVVTPAFVHASVGRDTRSTPLPVIRPTRDLQSLESGEADDAGSESQETGENGHIDGHDSDDDEEEDDARVESPLSAELRSTALLHPKHMLEVFHSKQMPIASPVLFSHRLREGNVTRTTSSSSSRTGRHQQSPPSRLQVLEWSEWKQKGLTEETADEEYASAERTRPSSPTQQDRPATPLDADGTRKKPLPKRLVHGSPKSAVQETSSAALRLHTNGKADNNSSSSGVLVSEERGKDHNTPEYKQKRLREILSTPVEASEANTVQLRSLARRVNTSFMVSLGAEVDELRREEAQVRTAMHSFIQAERDQLPLKFLFQLPGGAAYCRHRMRRAMALWILVFEDNQRRMALLQWKAFVEHCRFQVRGQEYHRLAVQKRLRVAIEFVLRGYLTQAVTRWVEATQELIWIGRDCAARKIQAQARRRFGECRFLWLHDSAPIGGRVLRDIYLAPCRHLQFQIPPRVREERRAVWHAAELVQSAYRRRRFRVFLARYRAAAAKIQAQQRMRAARAQYHALRRRIVAFQAYMRMIKHRRAYIKLRDAVVLVQTAFRCVRIRRLRRLVICAQRREHERFLSRVLLVQRVVRGFLGRLAACKLRRMCEEEFAAALVVQRAWYRRNNEWSTFFLLGCLRAKENEENAFEARVLAYKHNYMARQIRRAWFVYRSRKRNTAALAIQCNFRRHLAQRVVQDMRNRKLAHRRIKWFFRVHHARRIQMAAVVQFGWLRAAPGRLAAHLRIKRLAQEQCVRRALYFRVARAATLIQAMVRGHNDRVVARRERGARKIQRAIREFLHWRRIQHELRRVKGKFARRKAEEFIAAGFGTVYARQMAIYNFAATQIQRLYRGARWRSLQTRLIVLEELRERMATRIQNLWRFTAHRRIAKKLLQAQRRKLTNPFQTFPSFNAVLREMVKRSSAFFDPEDDLRGMTLSTWLRRLGLEPKYLEMFQKSRWLQQLNVSSTKNPSTAATSGASDLEALAALRDMELDACRRQLETIGINDEDDLELMTTSLFARETIRETKQLRDRIASMHMQQTALQRRRDLAAMALQKLEANTREAESALEEVLDEMIEFRNPPLALRKRREKCGKELDQAMKAVADAQHTSNTLKQTHVDTVRALELLQQEFSQIHEPREISALYSQQSLKLISDMNQVREMFLARFPGLEARALTFASALDEDQVTTWQLEHFFDSHPSVSAVKANMKELTYSALETETKKLEHTSMSQCADILQYGYERMCDLLEMPTEVVVLASSEIAASASSWGLIHQEMLDTIRLVRRASKASERAKTWRRGVDTLLGMNKTAIGVQSMWRCRAAKKLMAIVRDRRDRERILAEYVAEAQADHVTPIWEAERKKEQEELDAWLEQEALGQRLELLHQTLRFPYEEEWDEATQTYFYWREDTSALDGAIRQYALEGKPVYTIAEEDAAIVIQAGVRAFLARLEWLAHQREQQRLARRAALEIEWNRTRDERSQSVTLKVRVNVTANNRIASWLKHRRKAARQLANANAPPLSNSSSDKKKTTKSKAGVASEKPIPALRTRTSTTETSAIRASDSEVDAAWKKQMDAFVDGSLAAAYNRSVRAENRKDWTFPAHSRPLNVHGQAIVGLLSQFVQLEKRVARDVAGGVELRFTKVELRFGWKEVRGSASDGVASRAQSYYYNNYTGETTWERPEYTFDDEYAAIKMQSLVRALVAKNVLTRKLETISFVETVHRAVQTADKVGWVGFGLEGVSTTVFLSRFGLSKYAKELSKASIDDVVTLSDTRLKKLGWTKEEIGLLKIMDELLVTPRRAKYPLLGTASGEAPTLIPTEAGIASSTNTSRHPFAFLTSERLVSQIVSQSFPNQQGRVLGLVKAIRASSTPISFRQLEMHLRKFAGRPDEALSCIGEIASLEYATQEPQELSVCTVYLRCVERCIVFAANLGLLSLQRHLSTVLRVMRLLIPEELEAALALVPTTPLTPELLERASSGADELHAASTEVECYRQEAVARYPQKIVKGLWEQDPSTQQQQPTRLKFSVAQVALYLREAGLERVLLWVRSALLCQATFRMHTARRWYVATQAFRAYSATQIQCAWRVRCALEVKALLESQQQADYEQCYDKHAQSFFFVYTPTQEKLLDEPRNETGAVLLFRPMVQDRVTKRWVRAWPHYNKKVSSGKRRKSIGDEDAASGLPCSICSAERAARRCNECYSASGDYVDFCLVCFFDRHAPENAETSWHSYQSLHHMSTRFFHCVECRRFSTRRCLQCDENYCERCFQRVHGKGHKRTAHKCEQYDAMAQVCVECEMRVAFQLCLVCQDALCEDCMTRTHSKGARAAHDLKLIKQSVSDGRVHCEQCHARCGDERCEFCSRALCSLCLSNKHALVCPETELRQKRQQLLGDKVCVECGKAADRVCETCGDRYCSVRWMGNPGCFERFHGKGKRADHTYVACEVPAMSREILELEEKVRLKRKKDAEDAEVEARKLASAMLALAADNDERNKRAPAKKKPKKKSLTPGGSKRRVGASGSSRRCSVETCSALALGDGIVFCAKHFTLQHALEVTKHDPLDAAKLLAQIEREGGKLPSTSGGTSLLGSKMLGSLLRAGAKGDGGSAGAADKKKRTKKKKTTQVQQKS